MKTNLFNNNFPVFLAPMAGVTDSPFRLIARKLGCPYVFTEMISAEGIVRRNKGTLRLTKHDLEERPIVIQLFGSKPDVMAEAANYCQNLGFFAIDINMGCPVKKVVKNNAGVALMQDVQLAAQIVKSIKTAVSLPVTAKIRSGWSADDVNAIDFARQLEAAGLDAITIHPRTRNQFYSGKANWKLIEKLVNSISIPVIGNGDLNHPDDAKKMHHQTGCQGVMIGRASMGNPWLPAAMAAALENREYDYPPSPQARLEVFKTHLDKMIKMIESEERAVLRMRKHAMWYTRGFPKASFIRKQLTTMNTADDMLAAMEKLLLGQDQER
jgi:tRNA-dihydrouridine synthase B